MTTYTDSQFNTATPDASEVEGIIAGHAVTIDGETIGLDVSCLAFVCLACQSIAMCSAPEDVAPMRANFDLTCCAPETTLYPTF